MLLILLIAGISLSHGLSNAIVTEEALPTIDESDVFAAELAEKVDQFNSFPNTNPETPESGFTFFPAFLRFSRLNKSQNGRPPICFCCRTFVCHHQRCPCSKFIF
ncbi:hypothetical protein FO519_003372 [Halicephalobus sp. NKZ332]|nr:hypothetical protein FO519_003372 [Halicephalobus sp. NKZ332]